MVDRRELMELVRELGLHANVVEKDYVLGWLLAGISQHPALGPAWIFKGGTCLNKCYFETYRFSEDLDFTLVEAERLEEEFLVAAFREVADWVYEEAGIELPRETIRFEVYANPRGGVSAAGRIGYRGPLQPQGDLPRVRFDLTADEVLVLEPISRTVHHPYSDVPAGGIQVLSYCFEEVFAEKVRALAERMRPRDLHDVIHLYRHDDLRPDRPLVLETLARKCEFKGIPVPTAEALGDRPSSLASPPGSLPTNSAEEPLLCALRGGCRDRPRRGRRGARPGPRREDRQRRAGTQVFVVSLGRQN